MGNSRLPRSNCIDWLAKGPFAAHIDAYKQYLVERGYAANTLSNCMRSVAHFAQWARGRRLRVQHMDESVVVEFLDTHLPGCRCTGSICRHRASLSAALGHLLVVLRTRGVVAPPKVDLTPVEGELQRYDTYMDHVRGLAPKTRSIALRIVRRLL
ncbi:integrase, partial [bacterium]